MGVMTRRSVVIENKLWSEARQAAAAEELKTGESVSVSEYIRRALRERIDRQEKDS